MKLDDLIKQWEHDSAIDDLKIVAGNAAIPMLHAKYSRIYTLEKIQLKKMQNQYKMYRLEKEEFLLNPNQEDIEKYGWKVPARGKILKPDLDRYISGDVDLLPKELDLQIQIEKVDLLKSIMQHINSY